MNLQRLIVSYLLYYLLLSRRIFFGETSGKFMTDLNSGFLFSLIKMVRNLYRFRKCDFWKTSTANNNNGIL